MCRHSRHNPRGLNIRDRDRHLFLEYEDRTDNDANDTTYDISDEDNRENGDERDRDERNGDDNVNNTKFNRPPEQEMVHGNARVTINTTGQDNAGVHQNVENTGVHQNTGVNQNKVNTNEPHNDHDDNRNYPTIKMENVIYATRDEDEHEELEEAPVENDDEYQDDENEENKSADMGCNNALGSYGV